METITILEEEDLKMLKINFLNQLKNDEDIKNKLNYYITHYISQSKITVDELIDMMSYDLDKIIDNIIEEYDYNKFSQHFIYHIKNKNKKLNKKEYIIYNFYFNLNRIKITFDHDRRMNTFLTLNNYDKFDYFKK